MLVDGEGIVKGLFLKHRNLIKLLFGFFKIAPIRVSASSL